MMNYDKGYLRVPDDNSIHALLWYRYYRWNYHNIRYTPNPQDLTFSFPADLGVALLLSSMLSKHDGGQTILEPYIFMDHYDLL